MHCPLGIFKRNTSLRLAQPKLLSNAKKLSHQYYHKTLGKSGIVLGCSIALVLLKFTIHADFCACTQ